MATILNSAIFVSAILHKTLTQTRSIWLKFILTQLDDGSHPEFCHVGWQTSWPSWIHVQKKPSLTPWFSHLLLKDTSLIHSNSTWWWQSSWILPWLWFWDTAILDSDTLLSSLRFTQNTLSFKLWLWWHPSLNSSHSIWVKLSSNSFILI